VAGFERPVKRLLKDAGWSKIRQGSRASHEIWPSPYGTGREVSVPVKQKSRHTANDILKEAGIAKAL